MVIYGHVIQYTITGDHRLHKTTNYLNTPNNCSYTEGPSSSNHEGGGTGGGGRAG